MNPAHLPPLKVLIVDANPGRRAQLGASLAHAGYQIFERDGLNLDLQTQLAVLAPDAIIIDADAPDRDMLEHVCMISRHQPRPIVLFTDDDDEAKIKQAIAAGVTSYIVKGIDPARIKPILHVAISRFERHQHMQRDLDLAQTQLAERKTIERAKGIIMKQKAISEEEAFRLLRKMAMDRNMKLADLATQIVNVSEALA